MSDNILESGRWMERELNRFCERQINKEERRDMKKKRLKGIHIEASVSQYRQICV